MRDKTKILIAYDGSNCAEAALDDLQRAGLPEDCEAIVMTVTEVWLPAPPPSSLEIVELATSVHVPADLNRILAQKSPAVQTDNALTDRAARRLRTHFPGWQIKTEVAVGSPKRELISKADNWKPDLIVVGSHGHSVVARVLLGSVSQGVLAESRCSVRIARGRVEEPNTPVRIVVGVDGSDPSTEALKEAASRNWPSHSEVRIIAVNDPLVPGLVGNLIPPVRDFVNDSNRYEQEWLKKLLATARDEFKSTDLKVSTEILEGDPRRDLSKAAEEWGADCIFVGSVGFNSRFERFLIGSVSAAVAARSHCSVEVVRPRLNGVRNRQPSCSCN